MIDVGNNFNSSTLLVQFEFNGRIKSHMSTTNNNVACNALQLANLFKNKHILWSSKGHSNNQTHLKKATLCKFWGGIYVIPYKLCSLLFGYL